MFDFIKNKLHRFDRECHFISDIIFAISKFFDLIDEKITNLYLNFFFSSLTIDGVEYFEKLLVITPLETQTIEERRNTIRAKWVGKYHNSIGLIQTVCESWKRGEVIADFVGGKLQLKFINEYGVPEDLESLLSSVGVVKLAHIPFVVLYKYLLIEDIHEIKTVEEMENLTIDMFSFGKEEERYVN